MFTKEGAWPGITYPRSPGHEIAGVIEALGEDAGDWKVGDRVGVGWHGGNCFRCDPCRRGDFVNCKFLKIPGISYDGGYAAHVIAPVEALAHIPDALRPEEAAPLMCAGITTFNALRHSGAGPGDLVGYPGDRRTRAFGNPVCGEVRLRRSRDRTRRGQAGARAEAGRAALYRQRACRTWRRS